MSSTDGDIVQVAKGQGGLHLGARWPPRYKPPGGKTPCGHYVVTPRYRASPEPKEIPNLPLAMLHPSTKLITSFGPPLSKTTTTNNATAVESPTPRLIANHPRPNAPSPLYVHMRACQPFKARLEKPAREKKVRHALTQKAGPGRPYIFLWLLIHVPYTEPLIGTPIHFVLE